MAQPTPDSEQRAVSSLERGVFWLLVIAVVVMAAIWAADFGDWFDQPAIHQPADTPPWANKVDPNSADWVSLARLPGIGEQRAKDIIAYREQWLAANDGEVPFTQPDDLLGVKGLGPKRVAQIAPLLHLPTTRPDKPSAIQASNPGGGQ